MKETLLDIRYKLQNRVYTNEEHVRLSLVARILQELEWNIWDPNEVNTEFATLPEENKKKVDIALFLTSRQSPSVFIEVKALGKIENNLRDVERQLRDYNSEITSPFCIITDGCIWRFYLSQTGGKFYEKCFKTLNLLEDDIDDIEHTLQMFLNKSSIESGESKLKAEDFLKLTLVEKAMERCLTEARRLAQENPLISLADALVKLMKEEGHSVSLDEAAEFILKIKTVGPPLPPPPPPVSTSDPSPVLLGVDVIELNPHKPGDLRFTRSVEGQVGETRFHTWRELVHTAVKAAIQGGISISELRNCGLSVVEGDKTDDGFAPIPQLGVSVVRYSAKDSWKRSFAIAQKVRIPIEVRFIWGKKGIHPGRKGILRWSP